MLNITKNKEGTTLAILLEGDLDRTTALDLETAVITDLDGITDLMIDLDKLEYISSAGLRAFVKFRKLMDKQGTMRIINIRGAVKEILDLSGLAGFLTGLEKNVT
ncbi:MAG: STAS domain-containing protein [Oscillospiraceae bacterium]|nr:STAS domain-containing protein [Oscillospiraceae bacterium]